MSCIQFPVKVNVIKEPKTVPKQQITCIFGSVNIYFNFKIEKLIGPWINIRLEFWEWDSYEKKISWIYCQVKVAMRSPIISLHFNTVCVNMNYFLNSWSANSTNQSDTLKLFSIFSLKSVFCFTYPSFSLLILDWFRFCFALFSFCFSGTFLWG